MIADGTVVAAGALATAGFMAVFFLSGIVSVAGGVLQSARGAMQTLRDPEADDDMREQAMRQASLQMLRALVGLVLRSALALAVAGAILWIWARAGLAPMEAVTQWLSRLDVICAISLAITLLWLGSHRLWPSR